MNIPYGPLLVNLDPLNVSLARLQSLISVRVLSVSGVTTNNLIVYIFKNEYVLNITTGPDIDIGVYLNQFMKAGRRMVWLVPGCFLLREDLLHTIFRVTFSNDRSIIFHSTINIIFSCDTMVNVCRCYPCNYSDVSEILSVLGGLYIAIQPNDYFNTHSDVDMIISSEFVYHLPLRSFLVDVELFDSVLKKIEAYGKYVKVFRGHVFRYEYLSHLLSVCGDDTLCVISFDDMVFRLPGCDTSKVAEALSLAHRVYAPNIIEELGLPEDLRRCISAFSSKEPCDSCDPCR